MPTYLAPHFTLEELLVKSGLSSPASLPVAVRLNLETLAQVLESFRQAAGVPLVVNSGYRTPAHNEEVSGSPTSDHPNGLAADVRAVGISHLTFHRRVKAAQAAGRLARFDQVIYYPFTTGHIHIGAGGRLRGEYRVKLAEGGYPFVTADLLERFPGGKAGAATIGGLLLVLLVLGVIFLAR